MSELKVIKAYLPAFDADHNDMLLVSHTKETYAAAKQIECYTKSEADKEFRYLQRALWNARVLALRRFSVLGYFQILEMKGKKSKMDFNEMSDRIDFARLKCKAKAKEYE